MISFSRTGGAAPINGEETERKERLDGLDQAFRPV